MLLRRFASTKRQLPSLAAIPAVDLAAYAKELKSSGESPAGTLNHPENQPHEEGGLIKSFLFGSEQARREAEALDESFSTILKYGRIVHELQVHRIIPGSSYKYVDLIKKLYPLTSSIEDTTLKGSWRAVVGSDMDTYVHLWEYKDYASVHRAKSQMHVMSDYLELLDHQRTLLRKRSSEFMRQLRFGGSLPSPRELGGIFELKTYDISPGTSTEWEILWRKGLEQYRKVMEPVGAWSVTIGPRQRCYHMFQFTDLEQRNIAYHKSWELEGLADISADMDRLTKKETSMILVPLPFSPLR